MKTYTIELNDELYIIYQDIAKINKKKVGECLSIVLEGVIYTMLNPPGESRKN